MPLITYVGPIDEVDVPQYRLRAKRGVPVEVSAEVAGRSAGPWVRLAEGEGARSGWPVRAAVDTTGAAVLGEHGAPLLETRDPGEGLLAQDCWEISPTPARRRTATDGAGGAGQEG